MLKVGDKVALAGTPNVLFGVVTEVVPDHRVYGDIARIKRVDNGCGHHVWATTGQQMADYANPAVDVVLYKEEPKEKLPAVLVRNKSGMHVFEGTEISERENGKISLTLMEGKPMGVVRGDSVYKLVGRVEEVEVTEEPVPVGPGYKYYTRNYGGTYEVEVIAIRGDYAFIQTFKDGVAGGCNTVRISSIPKMTRTISPPKKVLGITKEQ